MPNGGSSSLEPTLSSEIEIRQMELEDLSQVFALGERLFTPDKWPSLYRTWDEYEVTEYFVSDGETSLVAERDGQILGFVLGNNIEKRRSSWVYGYLVWLGVDPAVGRTGLGSRLVQRFTEICIEEGARMMILDTAADNENALAFFREQGFGHEEAHIYLSKNLTHNPLYERHRRRNGGRSRPRSRIPGEGSPDR